MNISDLFETTNTDRDLGATLYHGSDNADAGVYPVQKFRTKPLSTFLPIHRMLSAASVEKFGVDVRSLLFASMVQRKVKPYGRTYVLIPRGSQYSAYVNDGVHDMTMALRTGVSDIRRDIDQLLRAGSPREYISDRLLTEARLLITDINHGDVTAEDLKDVYYILHEFLKKALIEAGHSDYVENDFKVLLEELANFLQGYEKAISEYINGIKKVEHASEIQEKGSELMLYLPDGFELKHRDE